MQILSETTFTLLVIIMAIAIFDDICFNGEFSFSAMIFAYMYMFILYSTVTHKYNYEYN